MTRLIEYVGNHLWLVSATALVLGCIIVYELRVRATNFAAVSPQEAIRLMNQGSLVLDIRAAEQFAQGHLNGARQLPADQILTASDTLKKYKEKPVLVYCENGSLGAIAARQLLDQGFSKALHLRGGLTNWRTENLPLAKG
jgi:rhodanese-related sulfurtransferase